MKYRYGPGGGEFGYFHLDGIDYWRLCVTFTPDNSVDEFKNNEFKKHFKSVKCRRLYPNSTLITENNVLFRKIHYNIDCLSPDDVVSLYKIAEEIDNLEYQMDDDIIFRFTKQTEDDVNKIYVSISEIYNDVEFFDVESMAEPDHSLRGYSIKYAGAIKTNIKNMVLIKLMV